jgi:hypothetical protein
MKWLASIVDCLLALYGSRPLLHDKKILRFTALVFLIVNVLFITIFLLSHEYGNLIIIFFGAPGESAIYVTFLFLWNFKTIPALRRLIVSQKHWLCLRVGCTFPLIIPMLIMIVANALEDFVGYTQLFKTISVEETLLRRIKLFINIYVHLLHYKKLGYYITISSCFICLSFTSQCSKKSITAMTMSCRETVGGLRYQLMSPNTMFREIKKMRRQIEAVEKAFSILPLMWFYHLFEVTTRLSVVSKYLTISTSDTIWKDGIRWTKQYAELLSMWIMFIFLTFSISNQEAETKRLLDKLSFRISAIKENVIIWTPVFEEIKKFRQYTIRCFSLFPLGKQTLIPFVSSCVPLTVMIVQLFSKK